MNLLNCLLAAMALIGSGCSRGPARVSVNNQSGITLSNVWLSGPHFAQPLGLLTPGQQARAVVQPAGETLSLIHI